MAVSLAARLRRGDLFVEGCPSREVMRHVTSSWGVLALIALQDGTLRFGELRRRLRGMSERMLAQTLQRLEGDRLLVRRSYPVVPPHTDYTLTELGREAAERVAALADWVEKNVGRLRDVSDGPPPAESASDRRAVRRPGGRAGLDRIG